MKTSELQGATLDWAVAKCEGFIDDCNTWLHEATVQDVADGHFKPSTNWEQSGPIIEREGIALYLNGDDGWTGEDGWKRATGPTPLVAAMRAFVASKLGEDVEIPAVLDENEFPTDESRSYGPSGAPCR